MEEESKEPEQVVDFICEIMNVESVKLQNSTNELLSKLPESVQPGLFPDIELLYNKFQTKQSEKETQIRKFLEGAQQDIFDHPDDPQLVERHERANQVAINRFRSSIEQITKDILLEIRLLLK